MFNYIINPISNRKCSIKSKKGLSIIKNYLKILNGGAARNIGNIINNDLVNFSYLLLIYIFYLININNLNEPILPIVSSLQFALPSLRFAIENANRFGDMVCTSGGAGSISYIPNLRDSGGLLTMGDIRLNLNNDLILPNMDDLHHIIPFNYEYHTQNILLNIVTRFLILGHLFYTRLLISNENWYLFYPSAWLSVYTAFNANNVLIRQSLLLVFLFQISYLNFQNRFLSLLQFRNITVTRFLNTVVTLIPGNIVNRQHIIQSIVFLINMLLERIDNEHISNITFKNDENDENDDINKTVFKGGSSKINKDVFSKIKKYLIIQTLKSYFNKKNIKTINKSLLEKILKDKNLFLDSLKEFMKSYKNIKNIKFPITNKNQQKFIKKIILTKK